MKENRDASQANELTVTQSSTVTDSKVCPTNPGTLGGLVGGLGSRIVNEMGMPSHFE